MPLKDIIEIIVAVGRTFTPVFGTLFLITIIAMWVILVFFKKRIEKTAEEISDRTLKKFEKKLDLSFRDEGIRTELILTVAKKSIDAKLEMYDEVYRLYFDYQKSWKFDLQTTKERIDDLWDIIWNMRRKIFLKSIYLGGPLTDNLLKAVVSMATLLQNRITQVNSPFQSYYDSNPPSSRKLFSSEENLGEYLDAARKWLNDNLLIDQNLKTFEISDEEKRLLEKERKTLFCSN